MRLLAIDGNSIINRAYYGIRPLSNHQGIFTNALFGFMNIYFKALNEVKPDAIAVAFDLSAPTFRHEADKEYKSNRKGMPDELAMQMPYLKQILKYMGIVCLSAEGFEADDILGTLAEASDCSGQECVILTGDRDSLQLITEKVSVHLATNKETVVYTPEKFEEEYGFAPRYLIDLKALMGDTSDHISGVKGIGEKTAKNLIQNYESIEKLYANLEEVQATPRVKKLLLEGKQDAEKSKFLATIVKNAPVSKKLSDYVPAKQDSENLRRLLTELEMYKLLERLHLEPLASLNTDAEEMQESAPELTTVSYEVIQNSNVPVAYQLTEGENFGSEKCLKICVQNQVFCTEEENLILEFLESALLKMTDDAKEHYHYALEHHRTLKNVIFDASVAGYLLNPSASDYSVSALCAQLHVPYFPEELNNQADLQALEKLSQKALQQLEKDEMLNLYNEIELPLTRVLASMEHEGILVDIQGIQEFGRTLTAKISSTQKKIYELAGEVFNIASPKQLGVILFEKLNLPVKKKTKTGYSTNAEVLEELRDKHEIIDFILEYRQYTKLQSTYVDGLLKTVAEDGRIHTNYKQTETRTGRISSTEPNLQNIPVRTELGRQMWKFFQAGEGNILLDADYSQIELRLMAHLSGDEAMQEAFQSGADIHTATAAKILHLPESEITPQMRSNAKAINFGILYGMGAFSLSKDIHVSKQEAQNYIDDYLGSFPKVSGFLEKVVEDGKRSGYVCTMYHRRRYVPELQSKNKQIQSAGKRIAMNTPVQGTAADVIKLAMIRVHDRLKTEVPTAKLLLQVHDELIVEVPVADAEQAAQILHEEMIHVAELAVPLIADVSRGKTWYDAKS
ncbi:MAG: DNA polymerase I [Oscillospiraceae bacterium]|nr:DNA polymerase I [Oscillospiraceae bacterium]